ncbi:hypothetical protein CBR_g24139 [Chara braunii]|uniref:Exostosin GT47 domain-containing protein n=1 Tax=Chara braunii TaxID=69332 RepID=A0A388L664_CHABU|nr:hypothetical protein CBR_g24139 [Chara braunii]|eukprot:GBG77693.1 hypothetical protein CBR_g24139 [Chara braunii]
MVVFLVHRPEVHCPVRKVTYLSFVVVVTLLFLLSWPRIAPCAGGNGRVTDVLNLEASSSSSSAAAVSFSPPPPLKNDNERGTVPLHPVRVVRAGDDREERRSIGGGGGGGEKKELRVEDSKDSAVVEGDNVNVCCTSPVSPVRVYVYDLPARVEMPLNISVYNDSRNNRLYIHSLEYWMLTDLRLRREAEEERQLGDSSLSRSYVPGPVRQVYDPAEADLFLVPFLGSQSRELCCNLHFKDNLKVCDSLHDTDRQKALREWMVQQEPWIRSGGFDHIFMTSHPLAMADVRHSLHNAIYLSVDFGFFCSEEVNLDKDVVVPYNPVVPGIPQDELTMASERAEEKRTSLLYFRGEQHREYGGAIRSKLWDVLNGEDGVDWEGTSHDAASVPEDALIESASEMRRSHFCLNPAGDTPSSARLWDSLINLCIPVVVSDFIEFPFESWLNWTRFCIVVESSQAIRPGYIMALLRGITEEERREMRREIVRVLPYFDYKPRLDDPSMGALNNIWKEIAWKLPRVRLAVRRYARHAPRKTFTKDYLPEGTPPRPCRSTLRRDGQFWSLSPPPPPPPPPALPARNDRQSSTPVALLCACDADAALLCACDADEQEGEEIVKEEEEEEEEEEELDSGERGGGPHSAGG